MVARWVVRPCNPPGGLYADVKMGYCNFSCFPRLFSGRGCDGGLRITDASGLQCSLGNGPADAIATATIRNWGVSHWNGCNQTIAIVGIVDLSAAVGISVV